MTWEVLTYQPLHVVTSFAAITTSSPRFTIDLHCPSCSARLILHSHKHLKLLADALRALCEDSDDPAPDHPFPGRVVTRTFQAPSA
jgi:hypothetical protein